MGRIRRIARLAELRRRVQRQRWMPSPAHTVAVATVATRRRTARRRPRRTVRRLSRGVRFRAENVFQARQAVAAAARLRRRRRRRRFRRWATKGIRQRSRRARMVGLRRWRVVRVAGLQRPEGFNGWPRMMVTAAVAVVQWAPRTEWPIEAVIYFGALAAARGRTRHHHRRNRSKGADRNLGMGIGCREVWWAVRCDGGHPDGDVPTLRSAVRHWPSPLGAVPASGANPPSPPPARLHNPRGSAARVTRGRTSAATHARRRRSSRTNVAMPRKITQREDCRGGGGARIDRGTSTVVIVVRTPR